MGSIDLIRSVLLVMTNQGHCSLSPIFYNLTRDGFSGFMMAHSGVAFWLDMWTGFTIMIWFLASVLQKRYSVTAHVFCSSIS